VLLSTAGRSIAQVRSGWKSRSFAQAAQAVAASADAACSVEHCLRKKTEIRLRHAGLRLAHDDQYAFAPRSGAGILALNVSFLEM
jgi:hypothetical protein